MDKLLVQQVEKAKKDYRNYLVNLNSKHSLGLPITEEEMNKITQMSRDLSVLIMKAYPADPLRNK